VFTDDLGADPYETCDTQTGDEPEEAEEILTAERVRQRWNSGLPLSRRFELHVT